MAIPTNYIDKFTDKDSGESRIISPAADKVRVDNENFEGTDLDEVLDDIAEAIEDAGSGGYAPPPGGIPATDLAPAVQTSLGNADSAYQKPASGIPESDIASGVIPDVSGLATKAEVNTGLAGKVDKNGTDSLMSDAEHTKLQNLPSNPVQSISVNGGAAQTPQNGNVNIQVQAGAQGPKGDTGSCEITDAGDIVTIIVNDLTTGGAGNILSAEMGKDLNERLDDVEQAGGLTASVIGTTLYLSRVSAGSPVVNVGQLSKSALSARGGQTDTATFTISGRRLTGNIGIALSDNTNFALSASSLTPTDGKVSSTTITVTYRPASGATAGTTHPCTITISMGGTTYGTLSLNGTVASAPSIALSPSTLAISALSGEVGSGTINVSGSALDSDITLVLSGASYMSFDENSSITSLTVTKAEAEAQGGKNVTIYYTGTANDSGTLTASSTGASSVSASVSGSIREAAPVDTTFTKEYDFGSLTFVVRDKAVVKGVLDNGVYKRSGNDSFAYNADDIVGPIVACKAGTLNANADVVIPATVEYDGITYTVTEISTGTETIGTNGTAAFGAQTRMKTLTFAEGSQVRMIDKAAFYYCTNLVSAILPDSVVSLCSSGGASTFATCTKLESVVFGTGLTRTFNGTFNGNTALKYITFKGAPTLNGLCNASLTQFTQATYTEGTSPVVTCMSMTAPSMSGTPFPRNTDKRVSAKLRYPAGATGYDVGTAGGSTATGCWPDFLEIETFTPNS